MSLRTFRRLRGRVCQPLCTVEELSTCTCFDEYQTYRTLRGGSWNESRKDAMAYVEKAFGEVPSIQDQKRKK